jgi:hypothetical protein
MRPVSANDMGAYDLARRRTSDLAQAAVSLGNEGEAIHGERERRERLRQLKSRAGRLGKRSSLALQRAANEMAATEC